MDIQKVHIRQILYCAKQKLKGVNFTISKKYIHVLNEILTADIYNKLSVWKCKMLHSR